MPEGYVISKLINNNIVFSQDESGEEIILFGKAIGFGKKRGDYIESSQIIRLFQASAPNEKKYLINLVEDIEPVYIDIAGEIIDLFERQLETTVNDIMIISLSDHISNAVANKKEGIDVPLDIIQQIAGIYPKEFSIGKQGLAIIEKRTGIRLKEDEAGYIVLHYINCQSKDYRSDGKYRLVFQNKIIEEIEDFFQVHLDRDSLYYKRFLTHLSFLAARIHDNQILDDPESAVYDILIQKNPDLKICVEKSAETIRKQFKVEIKKEEKGYLALHIANMLKGIGREKEIERNN